MSTGASFDSILVAPAAKPTPRATSSAAPATSSEPRQDFATSMQDAARAAEDKARKPATKEAALQQEEPETAEKTAEQETATSEQKTVLEILVGNEKPAEVTAQGPVEEATQESVKPLAEEVQETDVDSPIAQSTVPSAMTAPAALTGSVQILAGQTGRGTQAEQPGLQTSVVDSKLALKPDEASKLELVAEGGKSAISLETGSEKSSEKSGELPGQDFAKLLEASRSQSTEQRQALAANPVNPANPANTQRAAGQPLPSHLQQMSAREPEQVASGLQERIAVMAGQKMQQAEIRLDPAELGSMVIRLKLENDQAQVSIVTQQGATRDLVEQSLGGLRQMLAERGIQLGDASVSQQSRQDSFAGNQADGKEQGSGQGRSDSGKEQGGEVNTLAAEQAQSASQLTVGVDYYA